MDRACLYGLTLHPVLHVAVQQELNGEGDEGRKEEKERKHGK